jgi:UDP-N-acetylmuramate: L-alanyl-gamma-D-glutamyl-meso-diaminopimelate ligase
MKMGVWKESLADSLSPADEVFCYKANLGWEAGEALASLGKRAATYEDLNDLIAAIKTATRPGDHVVVMSNGAFGDIHERLLEVMNSAVAGS